MSAPPAQSLAQVARAIEGIPRELARALDVPLPASKPSTKTIVTTGIGGSEGPARLLAFRLAQAGRSARFCCVSEFLTTPPAADLLIVFSQGLSPNGCLALDHTTKFRRSWVVTSVGYGPARPERLARLDRYRAGGVEPIVVPPGEEAPMLVRWVGPTVATLIALRLAGVLGAPGCTSASLSDAPRRYLAERADPLPEALALVLVGVSPEEAHGHRWKILEALLGSDPPVWDALAVAHGPLQALHARPRAILTLERPMGTSLSARLRDALARTNTRVLRFEASTDDALAPIEHAAQLDAALLATLASKPRDLFDWPGRGRDAPLYDLGGR